ncbi:hypothetical protein ACKKBG_A34940 [Auxenochlorella protothecoides x Auxenochlorella symbiontica]
MQACTRSLAGAPVHFPTTRPCLHAARAAPGHSSFLKRHPWAAGMPVRPALVAARRRVHLVRSQERDSAPARPQVPEQDAAVTALLAECGQDLEECDVEDSPELAPLKEALLRARRRRDEALGQREALEAEAQEVAQLAVNAKANLASAEAAAPVAAGAPEAEPGSTTGEAAPAAAAAEDQGGAIIGPYALGIIQNVSSVRHIAELGVVFLLFNIGLELSFDRLASMGKMVFGMGSAQVCLTLAAVAGASLLLSGGALGGAGAIIVGGGLALSTTAVGMQVLADRGETGSRHGRAAFSVLLFQDLAVVVLLMLIPLLTPSPENAAAGGVESLIRISKAIGVAAIKAVTCMATITVVGRWVLQPLYRRVAETRNPDIFAAMTLLVVLGTSLITQLAGLSLALGAFLAGLLLAETPFHLQIEADIAPYKGLLMGLFFMTVGMEISMGLLVAKLRTVLAAMVLLIGGKVAVMAGVGQVFGLSLVQSLRAGLLLSPGGEFAFVLFGEAVTKGILNAAMVQELYLVVALSMALTPFLAEWGARLGKILDKKDMKTMQPQEKEVEGLSDHVIIAGFGRVGRLIAEMLSEQLIPFVALDVDANRVAEGRALDLPVYFGDAGSPAVLHALRAEKAACAVITLDTPAANYRSVWALHKHFPLVKTFVRAHDVENGLQLEKAGATAVVPETLEPSLQLAAAVLTELDIPEGDVAEAIRDLRRTHLSELQDVARRSRTSLGYEVVGEQLRAVTGPELNGAGPLEPSLAAP